MPHNYQHWWAMYLEALFSFLHQVRSPHLLTLVVCCIFLSNANGLRESKYYCLQETKAAYVQSRCFHVAHFFQKVFFRYPFADAKRCCQCEVQKVFIVLNLEFYRTLPSRLRFFFCAKEASEAFDPKLVLSKKENTFYDFIVAVHITDITRRF